MSSPVMFGQNIYLLIALLLVAVIVAALLFAAVVGLNLLVWTKQRKAAEAADRCRKFRPDCQPYPPSGRGICTQCMRVEERVFHLADGQRLCERCYASQADEAGAMPRGG